MKLEFKKSFAKDLKKRSGDADFRKRIYEVIHEVENAETLDQIRNLKKLKGESNYYRLRHGDYRIGLIIEHDVVKFVRVLHRRDIYRYFP